MKLVTSLDNHDMDRFLSVIGEDFDKYKMGITWLLTTRGIPSWYYGTEILMKNFKNPTDAEVRLDFPGGFPGDVRDKFKKEGRDAKENEAFDYIKKLANYRKVTPALHSGKLMQYVPQDGMYVFFRYDANKNDHGGGPILPITKCRWMPHILQNGLMASTGRPTLLQARPFPACRLSG